MARFIFLALIIAVVVGLTFALFSKGILYEVSPKSSSPSTEEQSEISRWRLWSPQSKKFQVSLPILPQIASSKVMDPETKKHRHYNTYISPKDDNQTYMINIITLPDDDRTQKKEVIKKILNEMVASSPQNALKEIKDGTFKKEEAIDFTIENQETIVQGKAFKIGPHGNFFSSTNWGKSNTGRRPPTAPRSFPKPSVFGPPRRACCERSCRLLRSNF